MICRKSVDQKTGEVSWPPESYFNTFQQLLTSLANKKIREWDCTTFAEAIKHAENVAKEISSVFNVTCTVEEQR